MPREEGLEYLADSWLSGFLWMASSMARTALARSYDGQELYEALLPHWCLWAILALAPADVDSWRDTCCASIEGASQEYALCEARWLNSPSTSKRAHAAPRSRLNICSRGA